MFASFALVKLSDGSIVYKEVGTDRIVGDGVLVRPVTMPESLFKFYLTMQAPEMYPVQAYKFI